ncbi:hypothetical protein GCM10009000_109200 [Halobacterium noricense]
MEDERGARGDHREDEEDDERVDDVDDAEEIAVVVKQLHRDHQSCCSRLVDRPTKRFRKAAFVGGDGTAWGLLERLSRLRLWNYTDSLRNQLVRSYHDEGESDAEQYVDDGETILDIVSEVPQYAQHDGDH